MTLVTPASSLRLSAAPDADHYVARFIAMACACEVLIDVADEALAWRIARAAAECAWRIERKFSRYRADNIVHAINASGGRPIDVDEETARLLDFSAALTLLSDGRFDITSGVMRRVWTFDGGERIPTQQQIDAVLAHVGWRRVRWQAPTLQLEPGMEIDFGGVGKEYAVDAAVAAVEAVAPGASCLVNFGGDAAALRPRQNGEPWRVGIEAPDAAGSATRMVMLSRGGLATSGDARRYAMKNGKRYSHILDARTGWPVENAPRSATVAAGACTQAGSLTTLAMLQGSGAERFLQASGAQYWLL